ncbi:acyl-CoA thioesterase [Lentzea sp. NPDC058436]|uniref:acyl-CoA thioesterase n=1 Tax=Lentzea sp. NPDC058436 TaxID=3346499 RepID=UPI0036656DA1
MSFHWESPVFLDEADQNGLLQPSRFVLHLERAQAALHASMGLDRTSDLTFVVKELHVEFGAVVTVPGVLPVEITAERIGSTSARYGFRCGHHASGYRVIVKVGPDGRPAEWSEWYRTAFEGLR